MFWTQSILGVVDPARLGEAGLVTFVVVFIGVAIWTMTRRSDEVEHWSAIPLDGADDPRKE